MFTGKAISVTSDTSKLIVCIQSGDMLISNDGDKDAEIADMKNEFVCLFFCFILKISIENAKF